MMIYPVVPSPEVKDGRINDTKAGKKGCVRGWVVFDTELHHWLVVSVRTTSNHRRKGGNGRQNAVCKLYTGIILKLSTVPCPYTETATDGQDLLREDVA
uniref:Uncharacterized protein n=1 Tax=Ascaris lumbricoides TaxID=6252 RepID=A0A9J2PGW7_ASCLU